MRNLLYGIKGELFNRARKQPQENMTWGKMAQRLAKGVQGGNEQQILLKEEAKYTSLNDFLSPTAKGRDASSSMNLEHAWTQLLDHIYTVLGLIK